MPHTIHIRMPASCWSSRAVSAGPVSMLFWHYATGQALTGLALVQFFPSVAG
jgi:hypothetical protein